jgi:hypothetical protein
MRVRLLIGAVVTAYVCLVSAAPAAAQGAQVDVSGGYQFLRFVENGGANIPTGWGASIAVGNAWVKAVGDVGGHYKDGTDVHTFQGGLELSGKSGRVIPFVRVLAGLGYFTNSGDSLNAFVFTPEGGVKIMANKHVGAQVSLGFPLMRAEGSTETTMRVFAGIVIRH